MLRRVWLAHRSTDLVNQGSNQLFQKPRPGPYLYSRLGNELTQGGMPLDCRLLALQRFWAI